MQQLTWNDGNGTCIEGQRSERPKTVGSSSLVPRGFKMRSIPSDKEEYHDRDRPRPLSSLTRVLPYPRRMVRAWLISITAFPRPSVLFLFYGGFISISQLYNHDILHMLIGN